ncbi:hypothetical protein VNO77_08998 [Canavalia gladiata]|uniref:Uncharacterized protein n=1 Tax=Canavalia gladiata TaxID=3824 RepID=A0AAN9R184_CANGL
MRFCDFGLGVEGSSTTTLRWRRTNLPGLFLPSLAKSLSHGPKSWRPYMRAATRTLAPESPLSSLKFSS